LDTEELEFVMKSVIAERGGSEAIFVQEPRSGGG
jgi:hypothetical protein